MPNTRITLEEPKMLGKVISVAKNAAKKKMTA